MLEPAHPEAPSRPPANDVSGVDVVVSVLVGLNFAVASPVLDYLGRNPDVFTVRDSPPSDVVGVLLLLTVILPLAIGLLARAAYAVRRRFGRAVHASVLVASATLFVAQLLDRLTPLSRWPAWALFAVAAALATLPTIAYFRNRELRWFVRFGVIAPLGFAAVFAFLTPARSLLAPGPAAAETEVAVANPVPVVLVLFDGLPAVALMDDDRQIDHELFPEFARFADDATWFRNATTHHAATRSALPGLFTGSYTDDSTSPVVRDHPRNLYTTLADHYRVVAFEPVTGLCPETLCAHVERQPTTSERWSALSRDVGLLGLHAVLPDSLDDRLPPAERALGEFAGGGSVDENDEELVESAAWRHFLDELEPGGKPGLHVFHWLKPHFPWVSLPSGQEAFPPSQEPHEQYVHHRWDDDWLRVVQWQRHLLQAGFVDSLLGELLDGLDRAGIYDEALVIIASDHGEAFTVGQSVRIPGDGNLGDVAFPTLLVKAPGQQQGEVVDHPVELVDVFPTVLDVLDLAPTPETDGRSLRERPEGARERFIEGWDARERISPDGGELDAALARKVELFGADGGWERIFEIGPFEDLIGRTVSEVGVAGESSGAVQVHMRSRFDDVDVTAPRLPTLVSGRLTDSGDDLSSSQDLALALNGRIAAVVRPYDVDGSSARILGVIPQEALAAGRNVLEVFEVRGEADRPTLWSLSVR